MNKKIKKIKFDCGIDPKKADRIEIDSSLLKGFDLRDIKTDVYLLLDEVSELKKATSGRIIIKDDGNNINAMLKDVISKNSIKYIVMVYEKSESEVFVLPEKQSVTLNDENELDIILGNYVK